MAARALGRGGGADLGGGDTPREGEVRRRDRRNNFGGGFGVSLALTSYRRSGFAESSFGAQRDQLGCEERYQPLYGRRWP